MSGQERRLTYLEECCEGTHGEEQRQLAKVGLWLITTVLDKNNDYGASAWRSPRFAQHLTPEDALWTRFSEKIDRLEFLLAQPDSQRLQDESVSDTLLDTAGYSLLLTCQREPNAKTNY